MKSFPTVWNGKVELKRLTPMRSFRGFNEYLWHTLQAIRVFLLFCIRKNIQWIQKVIPYISHHYNYSVWQPHVSVMHSAILKAYIYHVFLVIALHFRATVHGNVITRFLLRVPRVYCVTFVPAIISNFFPVRSVHLIHRTIHLSGPRHVKRHCPRTVCYRIVDDATVCQTVVR